MGIMTMLISALAFGQLKVGLIVGGVVAVEASAKLSMVVMAWAGKSVHQGMNSPFLEAMHGGKGNFRLLVALLISLVFALVMLRWAGFFIILAAVLTSLITTTIAHRHFNGVTGDVFGATNEITRMVCIIVLVGVAVWA